MESSDIEEMEVLVKYLVTSGKDQLDANKLKGLENICQKSDNYVKELYKCLLKWLKKKHAEIRFSAFQIVNQIFIRSHCFRCLVIRNLLFISKLVIDGITKVSLPKPKSIAKKLSGFAIKIINEWHLKYNEGYYELELIHNYLKRFKYVNYQRLAVITPAELNKITIREEKDRRMMIKKIQKIKNEMDDYTNEIENTLATFRNCFQLIIPDVHQFHLGDENIDIAGKAIEHNDVDCAKHGSTFMQRHGFTKETTVQVDLLDINKVNTTMDNHVLINALKDQITIMKKRLRPKIRSWESSAMPYASIETTLIKKIIDVKCSLENNIQNYESISFLPPVDEPKNPFELDSESDDDFIDVPLEQNEIDILGLNKKCIQNNLINPISMIDRLEAGSSGVPKTSVGNIDHKKTLINIDDFSLEKWEPPITMVTNALDTNQVWSTNECLHDYGNFDKANIFGVSTQIIDYKRQFEPIKWQCRSLLPSGKLCPRKDRQICPLHGPIIARNLVGKPIKESDIVKDNLRQEERERKNPPWQNPQLLSEIKFQTGIDLDMKKAKKRRGLYHNLTVIHKIDARSRLTKKIFRKNGRSKINM